VSDHEIEALIERSVRVLAEGGFSTVMSLMQEGFGYRFDPLLAIRARRVFDWSSERPIVNEAAANAELAMQRNE
jgi:hypothetical protein